MEKARVNIGGEDFTQRYSTIHIRQELGWHHSFEIRILLTDILDKFKGILSKTAKDLFGKPVEISLQGNKCRGVVTGVSLNRVRRQENELVITGGSPTVVMDEGPNTISFYEQTLKQIADTLINQYSDKFKNVHISPKAKEKIKYVVQYKESTFQFLARMATSYGEWFFFDGEEIFFTSKPPQQNDNTVKLYQDKNLLHFDLAIKASPVNFKLAGYDYKKHKYLSKEAAYNGKLNDFTKIAFDKSRNDLYSHTMLMPIHQSLSDQDLEQLKILREQAQVSEMVILSGSSTEPALKVGSYIQLLDERSELVGNTEDYGTFIITHLEHSFGSEGDNYINTFEAVPAEVEIPPLNSSLEPPFCEMQLADVVETNDPDALGRIRVQFLWQRGTDQKSPWIRVASPYSGKDKGFYVIPEIGDQVVVAFEHNNPDRPYALTGLYNAEAKPENHNSGNHLKALKTRGGNTILMNDEQGKESFGITGPKDVEVTASTGKLTITAQEQITVESKGNDLNISSPGTITIHAKEIVLQADSKISLKAPSIESTADKDFKANSPTITIDASSTNTIKGATMNMDGAIATNITGGMIKLN
ncbi:type VI secretion system Vgr family protein [Sabulibacter ruber]|uniref:type VI secretion system Vgr family protein n=1 Tax=Sabulibacter ruber TaxID=2811901 RepID=UPI001A95C6C4|nr:type VI secretion system tip protein VgrG [Sabulibacter ruber]